MRTDPTYGDLAALRAKMVIWAKGLTHNGANAEDLVQVALLKMTAGRHLAPTDPREIEPWARVVLLNTFRYGLRRRVPQFIDLDDVVLCATENPETTTYCHQMFALAGNDLIRAGMGFDYSRGMKAATLRSRRHRARLALLEVAA